MAAARPRPSAGLATGTKWSLYAGGYAFLWGTLSLLVVSPITGTLAELIGLPAGLPAGWLAIPAAPIGAIVWWAVIERRGAPRYVNGLAFGVVTALFVVLWWVLLFAVRFGSLVLLGWLVVVFVFVVSLPGAVVAGTSLVYARRRLEDEVDD